MSPILLRGGLVIDPASALDAVTDVVVVDGRIASIGVTPDHQGMAVVDCEGFLVTAAALVGGSDFRMPIPLTVAAAAR